MNLPEEELIRVKDKRKGIFVVDNVVLNGYGKELGATGIAFYVTLCRYADNQTQTAYPSITAIQNETGMDRKTILSTAKKAEKLKLIKKKVKKGSYTVYTLLEPKKINPYGISTSLSKNSSTGGKNTTTSMEIPPTGGNSEENELRISNLDNDREKENYIKEKEKLPDFTPLRQKLEAKGILKDKPVIKSYLQ